MDRKLMAKVFGVVWLSEMGDKTQVTTLLLASAKPLYTLWIALGSASALVLTCLIEVTIGSTVVANRMSPRTIKIASGVAFIAIGVLLLTGVIGQIHVPV